MKTLIFTLDYELYGNGSGDVFKHIIEPTDEILDIAEKFCAKMTIFFEVIEYWKLKEEWQRGNTMGYHRDPTRAIEEQLRSAYARGHDIQLHLHPQWVDAVWTGAKWKVNNDDWRLGEYDKIGKNSLSELMKRGKKTLEDILGPQYRCNAFRAGGYNAQPSDTLVSAMRENGFRIDSSIVPGAYENGTLSRYDYRGIKAGKGFWYCGQNLEEKKETSDLMEFPIVSFEIPRILKYLSLNRIKAALQNKTSAKDTFEAKTTKMNKLQKAAFFFQKDAQTWDYCLFSKILHRTFLRKIRKQNNQEVFVLIGHPKSFVSGRGLSFLLKKVQNSFRLIGFEDVLNRLP